jgi:hypothetical protein
MDETWNDQQKTAMIPEEIFDVFLSHSHEDAKLVEELAKQLEDNAKFRVWLDKWVLVPGERWQQAMARGLDQAKTCAICIGEQTPEGWFREEIGRALNRQVKDRSFRVFAVLLPNALTVNVDDFLELRTWVDLRNGLDDKQAFHILVSGIQGVPPGRGPIEEEVIVEPMHIQVREDLRLLQQFRSEQLIDDVIALEYQRKVLDRLIGS